MDAVKSDSLRGKMAAILYDPTASNHNFLLISTNPKVSDIVFVLFGTYGLRIDYSSPHFWGSRAVGETFNSGSPLEEFIESFRKNDIHFLPIPGLASLDESGRGKVLEASVDLANFYA